VTERERALQLLTRIEKESLFASIALIGETGFVRTLVLGVLRWRSYIDHAIEKLAERRLKKLDPVVVEILRIGIYQLRFMDVARHAAVSETVDLAGRHARRARGFVNAILRRATAGIPEPHDLATQFAHPRWLVDRWLTNYGEERTRRILKANQEMSYPDALVLDRTRWNSGAPAGAEESALVEGMIKLTGSTADLDRSEYHPMDEGSAVIAAIAANTGDDILDMAAAPGGKTLYMRSRGKLVTSNDISLGRLRPLAGRHSRIVVSDGTHPPFRRTFETVLVDAPCSATGTIRKNPELKWRLKEEDLVGFAVLQKSLLSAALDLARQTVVYSTCSLEPEENDAVVAAMPWGRIDIREFAPPGVRPWIQGGVLRLTPESGADGFTAFALRRSGK
jgi:16S rRNA (cytosine967-C5)-methyltransferase